MLNMANSASTSRQQLVCLYTFILAHEYVALLHYGINMNKHWYNHGPLVNRTTDSAIGHARTPFWVLSA